jgi:hypothetical protein
VARIPPWKRRGPSDESAEKSAQLNRARILIKEFLLSFAEIFLTAIEEGNGKKHTDTATH